MRIGITSGEGSPSEQIRSQIRGLIVSGQLAAGESLPTVRQLARDLAVSPATVAKAYRTLEGEGLIETRVGSGTRVSEAAPAPPIVVVKAARNLIAASKRSDISLDDAIRIVRASW
ncbi:GntR family transcriptional regulator [Microbacterium sp. AISO3]|jgi:GntR family transcriptional regulator|uniref:GntR family transcriptional regulator n=1 Tax=Microbacterium TaxID=33882 RepID=UPI0009FC387F|nr:MULTISPECIES: GntR family transcriptional regulator [Microbacterium]OWP20354.1 GntR family transcriptional regulator [Microbacterium sp. AISO3]OWP23493.1 GntR family transcriptional regulator [Microbacterium sp. AISO3]POX68371.1 GntR family transcriptional regulator [Microbacterium sp. Ru50]